MTPADRAEIIWQEADRKKRGWQIRLYIGEEVIKYRPEAAEDRAASDEILRSAAVTAAREDGYELQPAAVSIQR